jgi:hypothetical protein
MSAICDVDLATYCGRIGRAYGQHHLCPPFALRHAAESWIARGIPLTHCLNAIERFLNRHASSCYSGSGDWNFAWLNSLIQTSWYEQQVSPPTAQSKRSKMQRVADPCMDRQPGANQEVDAGRSPTDRGAPVGNRSDAPGCGRADQPPPQSAKSIGEMRRGLNRIDHAIAFLRRELADGEVAAALLEEKAKASGLSLRTLDRARARLNVTCRRTGFAKTGKSWLSLPTAPKRRRLERQKRRKRETHTCPTISAGCRRPL